MKNSIWILLLLLGVGAVSFFSISNTTVYGSRNSSIKSDNNRNENNVVKKNSEASNINLLTYNELKRKVDNKNSFALLIASSGCSHCISFEPIVKRVMSEQNKVMYKVDILEWSSEEINGLQEIYEYYGTPTILIFKNGEVSTSLVGYKEYETFKTWALTNIS